MTRTSADVLRRLRQLRAGDAPTHGARVLSYVYDSGLSELDELADAAASAARPLNALDPTVFPSVAAMERDVIAFARRILGGDRSVVGSVTSGGTESCLLAVKTARDLWRRRRPGGSPRPRLVTVSTAHPAFQKAARLFDLEWDPVPADRDGVVSAEDVVARLAEDVALVVLSAPAYPNGVLDPVDVVAPAARRLGVSCHVDACFGGFVLPWVSGLRPWDLRVAGVTSISADLHKFGYAPKGASVLLHAGRRRHRAQLFATTRWPAYPVVNATLLGSKSASPLAAAWAITQRLGSRGYSELADSVIRIAREVRRAVDGIPGLAVMGDPVGPGIALIADDTVDAGRRVDPHRLADALAAHGWKLQHQPGLTQSDGTRIPPSVHLTITPVLEENVVPFVVALRAAADAVRGRPSADPRMLLAGLRLLGYGNGRVPGPRAAGLLLRAAGVGSVSADQPMSLLMALIERLPAPVAEALLTELIARLSEPR